MSGGRARACARMHARNLSARALAQPHDIGIQFFQLSSPFLCQDRLCQLKRELWKFFYACTQERTFRAGCTLFCNSCLLNFAKDELSDHDSENCSDIRRVTWFIICPKILTFLTLMFFTPPYSVDVSTFRQQWRQVMGLVVSCHHMSQGSKVSRIALQQSVRQWFQSSTPTNWQCILQSCLGQLKILLAKIHILKTCLLYTSPSPRDQA